MNQLNKLIKPKRNEWLCNPPRVERLSKGRYLKVLLPPSPSPNYSCPRWQCSPGQSSHVPFPSSEYPLGPSPSGSCCLPAKAPWSSAPSCPFSRYLSLCLHSVPAQAASVPYLTNVSKLVGVLQALGHTPRPSHIYWELTLPFAFGSEEDLAQSLKGLIVCEGNKAHTQS